MKNQLTNEDIEIILESLNYSKKAKVDHQNHTSYEFNQNQLNRLESVIAKVRNLRDEMTNE